MAGCAVSAISQQELFEAPARSRIIVHDGCTAWWGVDGSTKRVAIGAVTGEPPELHRIVRSAAFTTSDGAVRLSDIYRETRDLAGALAARCPPGLILVEQPSGSAQAVNHELEYAIGVIQAAVYDGVYSALGHAVRQDTVVSSWWKLRACGKGNVYKTAKDPQTGRKKLLPLEEYAVMQWARLAGYTGHSWDEADALAIAEAGRREHALEQR